MIGLVIVAHSRQLAEATRELARQMASPDVPIAIAAGMDDPANPFGTEPLAIVAALESVYSDEGVVVLMDLGSALLSAETALEFMPPEQRAHITLCDAPLVEGTLAAAIQAGLGSPVEQVLAEARRALEPKRSQLAPRLADASLPQPSQPPVSPSTRVLRVRVPNRLGLHARPAARLVNLAGQYDAALSLEKGAQRANARSINQVATLGARQGDELTFYADGPGAAALLSALQALVDDNFGDRDAEPDTEPITAAAATPTPAPSAALPQGVVVGIPAARGIGIAPALRLDDQVALPANITTDDPAAELRQLDAALEATRRELSRLAARTRQETGAEAGIFEAHRLIVQDPELQAAVRQAIVERGQNAAHAWWRAIEQTAARYTALDDAYLRARAADVRDVGQRVLRQLLPQSAQSIAITEPCILVADDLPPSAIAPLDASLVRGLLTAKGSATSHSALLAGARGIPAVAGLGDAVERIHTGDTLALDGSTGWMWLALSPSQLADLEAQQRAWLAKQQQFQAQRHAPAITADGRRIEVAANIGRAADSLPAVALGAEGVGVFRTELLFMDRAQAPSEEEQYEAYVQAAQPFGGQPVIIRTLDVGGDKRVPYLGIAPEENPFLGYRGIRYWLDTPAIARAQLRALCRASADHNLKLMFPMISTLAEVQQATALVRDVQQELQAENIPFNPQMEFGIMIEVPSALLIADQLARHVDFFSIGTNDLIQYLLAADRGNPRVSSLASPLQPAVLRAIQQVAQAAHRAGIWVGVCGEMAGQTQAVPLLVGLGVDELSMNAPTIPEIKALIRTLTYQDAQRLADEVLALESADAVAAAVTRWRG